jgi:hypothetical protein
MDDPDVVLRINGKANGGSLHPMIRQWFRPEGIDFEDWRLWSGSARLRVKRADEQDDSQTGTDGSEFHRSLREFLSAWVLPVYRSLVVVVKKKAPIPDAVPYFQVGPFGRQYRIGWYPGPHLK